MNHVSDFQLLLPQAKDRKLQAAFIRNQENMQF